MANFFSTIKAKTTKRSTTIIQVVLSTVLDMALCITNIPLLDIQSISLQQVSFLQANLCLLGYESFLNHVLSHCFFNCFIEVKFKKTTSDDLEQIEKLEQKVYNFLDSSVTFVNNRFLPLRNKLSPKVSIMQIHMNICPERKYKERHLENNGFINSHLCINTQIEIEHMEHDSSYTIIAVPQQKLKSSK